MTQIRDGILVGDITGDTIKPGAPIKPGTRLGPGNAPPPGGGPGTR
jgi:hypothetical protein